MKRDEPTPLTHASSEDRELLELLEAGRSDLPASDTVDALEARIVPLLVGLPSTFPPPAGAGAGTAGTTGAAGAAGTTGAAGAAGTTAGAAGAAGTTAGAAVAGGASAAKLVTAAVVAAAIGAGTWSLATEPTQPIAGPPARSDTTSEAPPIPRAAERSPASPARVEPQPSTPAEPERAAPERAAPERVAPERVAPSLRSAPPSRTTHASAESSPPPETEAALLSRAQAALASSPHDALTLTREHERTFMNGMLAPEREVIAIDALLRLGRSSEARARADRFLARSPHSAHARRVRVLISSEGP